VLVSGSLVLNDMYLVLNAALDGVGIGYIAEHCHFTASRGRTVGPAAGGLVRTFLGSLPVRDDERPLRERGLKDALATWNTRQYCGQDHRQQVRSPSRLRLRR
jgi:hypothetical protein